MISAAALQEDLLVMHVFYWTIGGCIASGKQCFAVDSGCQATVSTACFRLGGITRVMLA